MSKNVSIQSTPVENEVGSTALPKGHRPIRTFVLRQARMTNLQHDAYKRLMPQYGIDSRTHSWQESGFSTDSPLVLEIGFGMGHATAAIGKANPHIQYLGIEVHSPGVGALLARIEEGALGNIRIIQHDAIEVLKEFIPPGVLSGVHLFFPDPWPKKKHHKRRMYQPWFLDLVYRSLKDGGYVYSVTDWEDYGEQMLEVANEHPGFTNPHGGYSPPISWRPKTAFEHKGLKKDHQIREIFIIKKPLQGESLQRPE